MPSKNLVSNFYVNSQLDRNKIPNKLYWRLINPNSEVIAGLFHLG